jgi:histidyl-tRNA synthetase
MSKPNLSRGMRDFTPLQFAERDYIISIIKNIFEQYGFQKIETPVIEQLSTLMGKYGQEGDKLLFKILNNGEYLNDVSEEDLVQKNYKKITASITEKGLRYDLTVPLARYVAMNRNELVFPFKRYHIDKVWRADRPQKGRYREFYQCDADVVGSDSLLIDAELIAIFDNVFNKLDIGKPIIKLNNRKILAGIAEEWDFSDKFNDFVIAIDKLDKIGENGVVQELGSRGFSESQIHKMQMLIRLTGTNQEKLNQLKTWFNNSEVGKLGVQELEQVLTYYNQLNPNTTNSSLEIDLSLARGLDYYTGSIYEVIIQDSGMGSVCGGGRYNNLTESFGVPDMPGIGISFGLERIYDIMVGLKKFPQINPSKTKALFINFGEESMDYILPISNQLRKNNIAVEIFPNEVKIGKQIQYAEKKQIPFVLIAGASEKLENKITIKNIQKFSQETISILELTDYLKNE